MKEVNAKTYKEYCTEAIEELSEAIEELRRKNDRLKVAEAALLNKLDEYYGLPPLP